MENQQTQQIISVITTAIGNFGFPIVVASYLLVRFEKKIEQLTSVNMMLEEKIVKLTETINKLSHAIRENKLP
ncbi:YvrJ family protein [Xylanibacillus composti]|uniref:YvrJ family protein n=1 Tax=Xylanibacillus composti TaxID=1572762 RepID=A0A8J4M446_9BACL|nr:YvrJ family protein [Xylanibacillus composti]MDT9725421.1 YvrJ family protein [Xylanibacillus composti]GIQ71550.1 hypothetical protein XYCOK13_43740 [Xylanibacillus composti]